MPKPKLPPVETLLALRADGLTMAQIGDLYGVGKTAVLGAIRRAGFGPDSRPTIAERFWSKVDKTGPVPSTRPDLGACWLWTAALDPYGYGRFKGTKENAEPAHRWAYEAEVGPIPDGLQTDHLCRVRACVRPSHLEPVTQRENILRGESLSARRAVATHCIRGHLFDAANTIINSKGGRNCRACRDIHNRKG